MYLQWRQSPCERNGLHYYTQVLINSNNYVIHLVQYLSQIGCDTELINTERTHLYLGKVGSGIVSDKRIVQRFVIFTVNEKLCMWNWRDLL